MSDTIITVNQLSKLYRLNQLRPKHNTLRDALVDGMGAPARRLRRRGRPKLDQSEQLLWALKDLSFEVKLGEVVGIIGRNGAGKSTLLKILSRITEPTSGQAIVQGRVGSLLEVGTGFHPELSGRENIYLNGAILGMRRAEIERKFDEIVAFAEVERFLDTPVKRYSSGMYVRLAFAVAAHLEPEVLVVDEVLAVGDAAFQKKCLGKMGDVAQQGRTVLFVSHNMNAVQRLCPKSILLERGRLLEFGPSDEVITKYWTSGVLAAPPDEWIDLSQLARKGTSQCQFEALAYTSANEMYGHQPYSDGPLEFKLILCSDADRTVGSLAITIYDQYGAKLINADTVVLGQGTPLKEGHNTLKIMIDQLHLNPGIYVLGLWLADPMGVIFDHIESALNLEVVAVEQEGYGARPIADGMVTTPFRILSVESAEQAI
jgi:ABC-type polysaccharide/polyol phosphate transport system ATPase subunit